MGVLETRFASRSAEVQSNVQAMRAQVADLKDRIAATAERKNEALREILLGTSEQFIHPNSLCLHLVVVTRDEKILITRRSPILEYHTNTWFAVSIARASLGRTLTSPPSLSPNRWVRVVPSLARCLAKRTSAKRGKMRPRPGPGGQPPARSRRRKADGGRVAPACREEIQLVRPPGHFDLLPDPA